MFESPLFEEEGVFIRHNSICYYIAVFQLDIFPDVVFILECALERFLNFFGSVLCGCFCTNLILGGVVQEIDA